jgi:hypothetical protein
VHECAGVALPVSVVVFVVFASSVSCCTDCVALISESTAESVDSFLPANGGDLSTSLIIEEVSFEVSLE